MGYNNGNFCNRKAGYCEYARYCKRVPERIREELSHKPKEIPAIEVEIFKASGSGSDCQKR